MPELSLLISTTALLISASSFGVAAFAYGRDTGKVRAWSTVLWQNEGPHCSTPVMYIRVANVGRRPVSILNLVKTDGTEKWWGPLKGFEVGDVLRLDEIQQRSLAHSLAVTLAEGGMFEVAFRPWEVPEFIGTHCDPPVFARRLFVEDVAGRYYPVRGSRRSLKDLFRGRLRCNSASGADGPDV